MKGVVSMKKSNVKMKTGFLVVVLLIACLGQVFGASCGDVNSNDDVDILDALLIAQYYVGLNPANFDTAVADVNADSSIDIVDALRVAQYYVGLITELSCGTTNPDPIWSGGPYTLDGSSDYVDLPDGITSNLEDFSVAFWVNLNTLDTWSRIFDFGVSTDVFMMLTPASGDTGYPYFAITTSGNDGEQGIDGTSTLPTGSWQHFAVVKSGTTGILYINTQEVGRNSGITLTPADLGNTTNNYIGRSQWSQDPYLNASIDEFFVYDRALSASEVSSLGSNPPPAITPGPTVPGTPEPTPGGGITKIMPLGDSITDGLVVPGGYRIKLWSSIQSLGATIDFVGSQTNGPSELGDKNHEGHSGWRIDQIDNNINGWMDSYQPRIVLLHIGTNDIGQNYDIANAPSRLSTLIDKICARLPSDGKLYVAQLVPLNGQDQNIRNFNSQIPGIVQSKVNSGKPVYMVDMYNALTLSDLQDGVHPNRTGYDKMADVWFNAIRDDL
jgi:lysophospholipase L1-like esterase